MPVICVDGNKMCLAVPGEIIKIDGDRANIQYGEGVTNTANISLVDVKIGDYVLVHAGFAIKTLSKEEANETLALFDELLGTGGTPDA